MTDGVADMTEDVVGPHRSARDVRLGARSLRYVDVGTGPEVVPVHGLGGSWQSWWANIPILRDTHRVIADDLPDFGRSESRPRAPGVEVWVTALVDLLDHLGVGAATVVGHSMEEWWPRRSPRSIRNAREASSSSPLAVSPSAARGWR